MSSTIEALAQLVADQGRQIVELSKALAIAHEVYSGIHVVNAPPMDIPTPSPSSRKLYLTEEEEDEEYVSGDMQHEDTRRALEEIVAATGIPAPITFQ